MFDTILIVLIDILAFLFILKGISCLNKKTITRFLWNKSVHKIDENKILQYNKTVAFLYVLLGLCFLIVGLVSNYFSSFLARILLLLLIIIGIPILSSINGFIANMYVDNNCNEE